MKVLVDVSMSTRVIRFCLLVDAELHWSACRFSWAPKSDAGTSQFSFFFSFTHHVNWVIRSPVIIKLRSKLIYSDEKILLFDKYIYIQIRMPLKSVCLPLTDLNKLCKGRSGFMCSHYCLMLVVLGYVTLSYKEGHELTKKA